MAIRVTTSNPSELLSLLKRLIDAGTIKTWTYDSDGDFTHSTPQWNRKAWLRPGVRENELVFGVVAPKGVGMSKSIYAIYHGRFIETLLSHADANFDRAYVSALPATGDLLG
jgi:hypothetical protein